MDFEIFPAELGESGFENFNLWPGHQYGPLPYESTVSVIGRFAFCNYINGPVSLKKTIGFRSNPGGCKFPNGVRVDPKKMWDILRWRVPREEHEIICSDRVLVPWLFDDFFRFCPTCARGGYHSVWHQFRSITRCPIHKVDLKKICEACDRYVGRHGQNLNGVSGVFSCVHCGTSVTGEPYSLSEHEEFRESYLKFESFKPLQRWLCTGSDRLEILRQAAIQGSIRTWDWITREEFFALAAQKIAPLPASFRSKNQGARVSVLHWRLRVTSIAFAVDSLTNSYKYNDKYLLGVYTATLRKLHRWVFGRGGGKQAGRDLLILMQRGSLPTRGRSEKQIALALFRSCMEAPPSSAFDWLNLERIRVRFDLPPSPHGAWLPRLCVRAILLGVFPVLMQHVRSQFSKSSDVVPFLGRGTGGEIQAPIVHLPGLLPTSSSNPHNVSEGYIFFPEISGLDLRSLWPADIW